MKERISLICITLIVILTLPSLSHAADGKYRLGLQGTHFVSGLSGVMEISNPWALQGVIDFGVDAFSVRALNRFHQETHWNAYGLGAVGIWDKGNDDESALGLGLGIGIEYDWRGLSSSLPPIGWNLELGASIIPDFDFDFGIGIHWIF